MLCVASIRSCVLCVLNTLVHTQCTHKEGFLVDECASHLHLSIFSWSANRVPLITHEGGETPSTFQLIYRTLLSSFSFPLNTDVSDPGRFLCNSCDTRGSSHQAYPVAVIEQRSTSSDTSFTSALLSLLPLGILLVSLFYNYGRRRRCFSYRKTPKNYAEESKSVGPMKTPSYISLPFRDPIPIASDSSCDLVYVWTFWLTIFMLNKWYSDHTRTTDSIENKLLFWRQNAIFFG